MNGMPSQESCESRATVKPNKVRTIIDVKVMLMRRYARRHVEHS